MKRADLPSGTEPVPPCAKILPFQLMAHQEVRVDPYHWLREKENPEVLKYLEAENVYSDEVLKPTLPLQDDLFSEMKARIKKNDVSYPEKENGFWYFTKMQEGLEYPIHCRRPLQSPDAADEVILDVNLLAQGLSYVSVTHPLISDDGTKMAYAVDPTGDRIHTIYVKDLSTGELLVDTIPDVTGEMVWAADNKSLLYVKHNPQTLRSDTVYCHRLGEVQDALIYHEADEEFHAAVERSLSQKFIFVSSHSKTTSEVWFVPADQPTQQLTLIEKREDGHEYDVEDGGDRFYIRTNWQAQNFRLMQATEPGRANWKEVLPHRSDVYLQAFLVFQTHLALKERQHGLSFLRVMDRSTETFTQLTFKDPAYVVYLMGNREYETPFLRFGYESLTTPHSVIDYSFADHTQQVRKQDEIKGFEPHQYESQRLHAQASDGVQIPISLVYRKSLERSEQTPLLIYAYGSYGINVEPDFSSARLSLLDRGFVFAIAHIRGGSDLGRAWYEDGKLLKKKNTFHDFIAVTESLHKQNISSPRHTYGMGGSAGGLLMGAVLNLRPDLYQGVIAQVPFVDVLTTMLDPTLPLTTEEYPEWGNPKDKIFYDYIKSYSPYDNVTAQEYPHLYVSTGINDSLVPYWEPAKWVAKLRKLKKGQSLILFRTEMEVGHSGKSGRFEYLREIAREYAFLLRLEGRLS